MAYLQGSYISRNLIIFFIFFIVSFVPPGVCQQLQLSSYSSPEQPEPLYNPYDRPKNGPPLNNVIFKVNLKWLYSWLKNPQRYNPKAKMPNLRLEDEEIKAIIAYLFSIAEVRFPRQKWDSFLLKPVDDMSDAEWDKVRALTALGQKVWSRSRCTICHGAAGEAEAISLRVGVDLSKVSQKLNRDWLYLWLKEPKNYFPETLMPRYRLSEEEIRQLVEFILTDEAFNLLEEESEGEEKKEEGKFVVSKDPAVIAKGKRLIELSRCVICHEIKGIKNLLPVPEAERRRQEVLSGEGRFAQLLYDVRCLTCHKIQRRGGDYAPDLSYEGSRLNKKWILRFLQEPDMIRPLLQQMPKFNLSEAEAQTAADYIKSNLISEEIPLTLTLSNGKVFTPERVERVERVESGKKLFDSKGCQACHAIGAKGGALGPNLSKVAERLEAGYLLLRLRTPHRFTPAAVEPNYALSDEEALALTSFLRDLISRQRQEQK